MRSFDILFDVCLTRCCTNSPVPGDWRRHDIHMTSLQCISYIRHLLSLLHFSKIPAIIRQAWNETMTRFVSFREDDRIIKMMAKVGKCDTLNVISRKELPVASCTKEVNSRLAKRPLVFNGRLANRGLTSLVNRPQLVNEKNGARHAPNVYCSIEYQLQFRQCTSVQRKLSFKFYHGTSSWVHRRYWRLSRNSLLNTHARLLIPVSMLVLDDIFANAMCHRVNW